MEEVITIHSIISEIFLIIGEAALLALFISVCV